MPGNSHHLPDEVQPVYSEKGAKIQNQLNSPEQLAEIVLLSFADGQVTPALQQHTFPQDKMHWIYPDGLPLNQNDQRWWKYLFENDRSSPRSIPLAWAVPEVEGRDLQYDLTVASDEALEERTVMRGLQETFYNVENLWVGTRYYWKVQARIGDRYVAKSRIGSFLTHPAPPRWLHIPSITNVRDLGGWKLPNGRCVRQGMLYRGSEMNNHCLITEQGKQILIEDLGIRTDLDLRGPDEDPMPALDPQQVSYVNIPIASYDLIAGPEYIHHFRALFRLLADPASYPIYMHCWGGADRTGTVSFLTNALLGVSDEDLYLDYELTSMSIFGERLHKSGDFQEFLQVLALFGPDGSTYQRQVERYLRVIGLTVAEIESIRNILTE